MTETELFGRKVQIEIGLPGSEALKWEASKSDDLRIAGKVEKSGTRSPNTCFLEVYNVTETAVALAQAKGAIVRVLAGYDVPRLLFVGDINKGGAILIKDAVQFLDRILMIEATDGGRRFQDAHINETFSREMTAVQVFGVLAGALGVPLGSVDIRPDVRFSGISLIGPVRDALDKLAGSIGAQWSVQDGALQVLSEGDNTSEAIVIVSSKSGNLIGSPAPLDDGIEFTALLDGRIRPGRRVMLQSQKYQGLYRVREVQHLFDSGWDESFYTTVIAREI